MRVLNGKETAVFPKFDIQGCLMKGAAAALKLTMSNLPKPSSLAEMVARASCAYDHGVEDTLVYYGVNAGPLEYWVSV